MNYSCWWIIIICSHYYSQLQYFFNSSCYRCFSSHCKHTMFHDFILLFFFDRDYDYISCTSRSAGIFFFATCMELLGPIFSILFQWLGEKPLWIPNKQANFQYMQIEIEIESLISAACISVLSHLYTFVQLMYLRCSMSASKIQNKMNHSYSLVSQQYLNGYGCFVFFYVTIMLISKCVVITWAINPNNNATLTKYYFQLKQKTILVKYSKQKHYYGYQCRVYSITTMSTILT